VNVLVEFVRIGDSCHHESFGDRDESPKRSSIDLSGDIVGNTESLVRPSSRDYTDSSVESAIVITTRREGERSLL